MVSEHPPLTADEARRIAERCLEHERGMMIHPNDAPLFRDAFLALAEKLEREGERPRKPFQSFKP